MWKKVNKNICHINYLQSDRQRRLPTLIFKILWHPNKVGKATDIDKRMEIGLPLEGETGCKHMYLRQHHYLLYGYSKHGWTKIEKFDYQKFGLQTNSRSVLQKLL